MPVEDSEILQDNVDWDGQNWNLYKLHVLICAGEVLWLPPLCTRGSEVVGEGVVGLNGEICKRGVMPPYPIERETISSPFLFFSRPLGGLKFIDHVVGNQPDQEMVPIAEW